MIITDRTRIELDWKCPRMRMWRTEGATHPAKAGWGIVSVQEATALAVGSAYALGAERLSRVGSPLHASIIKQVLADSKLERPYFSLVAGALWGYSIYALPRIQEEYDILSIEPELSTVWPRPPLAAEMMVMTRPDMVLRRRTDGTVWVPDHKTTKWKDQRWLAKWPYALQLHIQALAVKDAHPEMDVQGSLVFGVYKGYEKPLPPPAVGGTIYSPLCGAYRSSRGEYSTRYISGWDYCTFNGVDYIEKWVRELPSEVLEGQYLISAPIFLREDMAFSCLAETLEREKVIKAWREGLVPTAVAFPHHTTWCAECEYQQACWIPSVQSDPLRSGFYKAREPHHSLEAVAKELQASDKDDTIEVEEY